MRLVSLMLLVFLLLAVTSGCSRKEPEITEKKGWISDYGAILSPEEITGLSSSLASYEQETCHQVFVLIMPTLSGESIESFSQRTATAWDIGQPGFGNGILLTLALQEGSARIEVNSAFDWMISDGTADRILKEVMFPYFKDEKFAEGIDQGLEEIKRAARLKVIPGDHRPEVCSS